MEDRQTDNIVGLTGYLAKSNEDSSPLYSYGYFLATNSMNRRLHCGFSLSGILMSKLVMHRLVMSK